MFNTEPDLKGKQDKRASSERVVLLRSTNLPCLTRGEECARWSPACVDDICLMQTDTFLFRIIHSHHVQISTSKASRLIKNWPDTCLPFGTRTRYSLMLNNAVKQNPPCYYNISIVKFYLF